MFSKSGDVVVPGSEVKSSEIDKHLPVREPKRVTLHYREWKSARFMCSYRRCQLSRQSSVWPGTHSHTHC